MLIYDTIDKYRSFLTWSFAVPRRALLISISLPVLGFLLFTTLPKDFFPAQDRDMFRINIELPSNASAEKTLERAVKSVLSQTYSNFELICVVNNSGDKTEDILLKFAAEDDRVVVTSSSAGLVPALNKGLSVATSEIIGRQDADDYWYPNKLESQVSFLENNSDIDFTVLHNVSDFFSPR